MLDFLLRSFLWEHIRNRVFCSNRLASFCLILMASLLVNCVGCGGSKTPSMATQESTDTLSPIDLSGSKYGSNNDNETHDTRSIERGESLSELVPKISSVGIYREVTAAGLRVTHVIENSSADENGVEVGDVAVAIDGKSVLEMSAEKIDALLIGEAGQQRKLTFSKASHGELTLIIKEHLAANIGFFTPWSSAEVPEPDLSYFDEEMSAIVKLAVTGKQKAAARLIENASFSNGDNPQYYLAKAINTALSVDLISNQARLIPEGSLDNKTPLQTVFEDIDVAVELDEQLKPVAADLLNWIATRSILNCAASGQRLACDGMPTRPRVRAEDELIFVTRGSWMNLLTKAGDLSRESLRPYLGGLFLARERFFRKKDLGSACFLFHHLAYSYSWPDPNSPSIWKTFGIATAETKTGYLEDFLETFPSEAVQTACVFDSMWMAARNYFQGVPDTQLASFWSKLAKLDKQAFSIAMLHSVPHKLPKFNQLETPKGALLYHYVCLSRDDDEQLGVTIFRDASEDLFTLAQFNQNVKDNVMISAEMQYVLRLTNLGLAAPVFNLSTEQEPIEIEIAGVTSYVFSIDLKKAEQTMVAIWEGERSEFDTEGYGWALMAFRHSMTEEYPRVGTFLESLGSTVPASVIKKATGENRLDHLVFAIIRKVDEKTFVVAESPITKFLEKR